MLLLVNGNASKKKHVYIISTKYFLLPLNNKILRINATLKEISKIKDYMFYNLIYCHLMIKCCLLMLL